MDEYYNMNYLMDCFSNMTVRHTNYSDCGKVSAMNVLLKLVIYDSKNC